MRQPSHHRVSSLVLGSLLAGLILVSAVSGAGPSSAAPDYPEPDPVTGDVTVHDPSMIRTADGTHYVFSTHNGIEMRSSEDGVAFVREPAALPNGAEWAADYTGGDPNELWAPDVSYHNGRYLLYYSASSFGSNNSAIGLATSTTAAPGSWQDQGVVYSSNSNSNYNAIDPALTVDADGKWWLAFGSFWSGIKMIELDPATGKPAAWNQTRYDLAFRPDSTAVEAPYIVRHDGFYYLFVSFDRCCAGTDSTYRVMVGRSEAITGPYVDRSGKPLADGGGTEMLSAHGDKVIGPGGQSVLTEGGRTRLVYHYYDATDNGVPKLGLNDLNWDAEGWPYVE